MDCTEILQGTKAIAEFMGWVKSPFPNTPNKFYTKDLSEGKHIDQFNYIGDWSELMPVVENIAKDYDVRITWMPTAVDVTYISRPDVSDGEISSMGGSTAIENTFIAVVKFVEWYNSRGPNRKKLPSKTIPSKCQSKEDGICTLPVKTCTQCLDFR